MAPPKGRKTAKMTAKRARPVDTERVSYLDQALWTQLSNAASLDAFARHWLILQCRMIPDASAGIVAFGAQDAGTFQRIAQWPDGDTISDDLQTCADRATEEQRGAIYGHRKDGSGKDGFCYAAYPFIFDDEVHGVVSIQIKDRPEEQLREVMRLLQWGSVGVEAFFRRHSPATTKGAQDSASLTLDLVASAVEDEKFERACIAAATELAMRLDCVRVSIGFLSRGHTRVAAMSHTARFGKRTDLIRGIGSAMDEAIDQRSAVLHPTDTQDTLQVSKAHDDLVVLTRSAQVLTVPFGDRDRYTGAIVFEFGADATPDAATVLHLEGLASLLGPILQGKRREDRLLATKIGESLVRQIQRLFGRHHYGRKLALTLLVAAGLFANFATDTYRVGAPASLEGMIRRAVVAPFDGYLLDGYVRAGDVVKQGAILAELDVHDLSLEHLRLIAARSERLAEYNQALAQREAVRVNVIKAQLDQADAEIALLDEQIGRSKLKAPFDGLVMSGDLSQSVGSSISRGDVLFEVGPLDAYRVILLVDDRQITDVQPGQKGTLLLASIPEAPTAMTVSAVTPVSEPRDGRNVFRVEALLDSGNDRLRPGMKGVAKIDIRERRLVWIWTNPLLDWMRIKFWSWWP